MSQIKREVFSIIEAMFSKTGSFDRTRTVPANEAAAGRRVPALGINDDDILSMPGGYRLPDRMAAD